MSSDGGLRAEFRDRLPHFDFQSVETGGTGLGVPDTNFCYNGAEGWIEFKQTDAWAVPLRTEQTGWLACRARHGGYVYVGVRRWHDGGPRRGPPVDQFWLLAGGASVAIKQNGLVREAKYVLGVWDDGPGRWDWEAISKILTRRRPWVREQQQPITSTE